MKQLLSLLLFLSLILLPAVVMTQVAPRPPVNQRWIINEDYTDEFNEETLDLAKWYDYHPRWVGRSPAIFLPSQVSVSDGNLQIRNVQLAQDTVVTLFDGTRVTYNIGAGAVISRKITAHFGYYEVNMQASRVSMSSTFWFSNPGTSGDCPTFSTELDVIETIGAPKQFPNFATSMKSNTHYFERDCDDSRTDYEQTGDAPIGGNSADDFHRYGVWWKNGTQMDFYIDGVKTHSITRRADKPLEREMHLNMVTETYNWQTPPTPEELANEANNATYYDYVRGMELLNIDADVPMEGSPDGNLVKNPGFEAGDFTDWIGWGGNPREVVMNNQSAGDYAARIVGGGAPEQVIEVTPNTEYILSCMAKVVTGQVALGVKPTDSNDIIASTNITRTEYADYSVTFNSGARSQVKIYFFAMAGGNEAFGDEFSVKPVDGGGEPEPIRYVQFSDGVEFLEFPQVEVDDTNIPARLLYQANTDRQLLLVLRDEAGAEISSQPYAAKAGYGHRLVDFPIDNPLEDGATYTLDAELRQIEDNELTHLSRLRFVVGGNTTSNRNPQLVKPGISPNPVAGELSISGVDRASRFIVHDVAGRQIMQGTLPASARLDVRSLQTGVYLLSFDNRAPVRFVKR
ncbi:carbohydrate binding domain-containing protein [Neolewinella persica]|uniref:carbohydrate binding domain-containing protein n=1 Tax=Neolewinella persica TaxID=70998 RepID=UPI000365AB18|nr:carbohydrate binding domain-containing protein [Neolewinella persica]